MVLLIISKHLSLNCVHFGFDFGQFVDPTSGLKFYCRLISNLLTVVKDHFDNCNVQNEKGLQNRSVTKRA